MGSFVRASKFFVGAVCGGTASSVAWWLTSQLPMEVSHMSKGQNRDLLLHDWGQMDTQKGKIRVLQHRAAVRLFGRSRTDILGGDRVSRREERWTYNVAGGRVIGRRSVAMVKEGDYCGSGRRVLNQVWKGGDGRMEDKVEGLEEASGGWPEGLSDVSDEFDDEVDSAEIGCGMTRVGAGDTGHKGGDGNSGDTDETGGGGHGSGEQSGGGESQPGVEGGVPNEERAAFLVDGDFQSMEEIDALYMEYAKDVGFAVRKGDSMKDEDGCIVRKFFYCNR
ncbi:hypothetical protein PIB30_031074 [Stylosanthes scabra]|uniref:FAR1 domain-containing protein n=1 Tax=Stylosanthes scabra TaxID=79078 RepID=A0ABU6SCL7_9FABA|nr:hypothetical protein [Stylosanthes scabra]